MRYIATGRIHPERANVHFDPIEWLIPEQGKVVAQCESSQVTVLLELASIDSAGSAYISAEHFATIVIGALGFSLGSGYSIELIQVIEEDGTPRVFGVRPTGPTPHQLLGFNPHIPIFNRALQLASKNIFFRLALRDFLRAINDTNDCAMYCYRAIESIKSAFVSKTGKDLWDEMHSALGTSRTTIDTSVKCFADPVRHGNWIAAPLVNVEIRWEMLLLTRNILLGYLDYELPVT